MPTRHATTSSLPAQLTRGGRRRGGRLAGRGLRGRRAAPPRTGSREGPTTERPAYDGRFVSFSGVHAFPRPSRPVPIVVGGESAAAYRRAVEQGHGWYGFALDLEATAACLEGLREAAARYERPAELGELEISVTPTPT